MSHLIDPCLRATKIAHGIRRGIDGISPLSGLVPELRILIQEQKNVLASLKRTAFEKEEAAKHLAIYGKTEGPDIADSLSKLALLIQKAADLERVYSDSLAQSRELFKEIRVAEDENYSVRKRKLDLEQRLSLDKTYTNSSVGKGSFSKGSSSRSSSIHGSISGEVHPEMKLLRQETMAVENELEDLKRKKIKKATTQQLDALEKLGKELVVIAYYGKRIVNGIDDTPTPAGTHADDRYADYEGTARSAYSVKACLDTFQSWSQYAPIVQVSDIDLGDFPKDNKQAMDAMLQDLAIKSDSDWYALQSPSSPSFSPGTKSPHRTNSVSSSTVTVSPRTSMSSVMTTMTYVDGKPVVQVINEIPPTPEQENGPSNNGSEIDVSATATSTPSPTTPEPPMSPAIESAALSRPTTLDPVSTSPTTKHEISPLSPPPAGANGGGAQPSPFEPQSTYIPATTYQQGETHHEHKTSSPPSGRTSRPVSGDFASRMHLPHPLMMQRQPSYPPHHHQSIQQPYPPVNGGLLPSQMPMSMPMPMPVPHIPELVPENGHRRHSQPISVSFPGTPPNINIMSPTAPSSSASSSSSSSSSPQNRRQQAPQQARNPQAIISLPESSSNGSISGGFETDTLASHPSSASIQRRYDGPPPDYAEASMSLPAEMRDKKKKL